MTIFGWDYATLAPLDEAALSEGFCPKCHAPLKEPSYGVDGATIVMAAPCSACPSIYLLPRSDTPTP